MLAVDSFFSLVNQAFTIQGILSSTLMYAKGGVAAILSLITMQTSLHLVLDGITQAPLISQCS